MIDLIAIDPKKRAEQLISRINVLREQIRLATPETIASRTGIPFNPQDSHSVFSFQFMQQSLCLNYPSLELSQVGQEKPPNPLIQALVIYYLHTADGTPLSHRWIAFSELPNGMFYNQAFQGYTGQTLARSFKDDFPLFSTIANIFEGTPESFGDAAFRFQILPRLPLLVVGYCGDEEFPCSFNILFDSSVSHYLPTDGVAIVGSMITEMFVKNR